MPRAVPAMTRPASGHASRTPGRPLAGSAAATRAEPAGSPARAASAGRRPRSSRPSASSSASACGARADRQLAVARRPGATRRGAAGSRSGRDRGRRPRAAARSPSRPARTRRASRRRPQACLRRSRRSDSETRTQNDSTVAAPDPAAELVELGEPEPVGALDDHHRRRRHVDADLDHGRADQHVQLAVAEPGHLGVAVGRLQPAVDHARPAAGRAARQAHGLALGRDGAVALVGALLDQRHHHERPMAQGGLLADLLPRPVELVRLADARSGSGPGPPAASAGRTRRGRRRAPGRGSAGSGVAVMSRTWGDAAAGLRLERPRWSTPKRCCSSMTTRPRSANDDGLLDQRVRADDDRRLARRDRLAGAGP